MVLVMYGPLITSTLERGNFGRIISESKDTNDKIQAQWNYSYTYNNDLLSGSYSESPHATQHNIAFQHIEVQMQFVSKHGSIKFRQKGVNIGTIPFLAEMSHFDISFLVEHI